RGPRGLPAGDLQKTSPGLRGHSCTHVFRTRAFYLACTKEVPVVPQVCGTTGRSEPTARPHGEGKEQGPGRLGAHEDRNPQFLSGSDRFRRATLWAATEVRFSGCEGFSTARATSELLFGD